MANYANLIAAMAAVIKTNGQQDITGNKLQQQLRSIIGLLGAGYQFGGIVTPNTPLPSDFGDYRVFFLANVAGTYTNYGGFTLNGESWHLLVYGATWDDVDLKISSADISRDFGHYAGDTDVTLSIGVAGKYIDKDTAQEVSNASYAISAPISLNAGDILLVPSASPVLAACSVVSRKVTNDYDKVIIYTYTYDVLGRPATATADYDSSLVYTAHYADDEASTPDYWVKGGTQYEELPATHAVTESFYEPLVKQSVAGMPSAGYYVYLASASMQVVISAFTETIDGGTVVKVGWGLFKNIATNFVGIFGQRVIAEAIAELAAQVAGIQNRLAEGLPSLRVESLLVGRSLSGIIAGGNAILQGAGAPSAAVIPAGWDYDAFGKWMGIPQYVGQEYFDTTGKIWYKANGTAAVADWVRISNA